MVGSSANAELDDILAFIDPELAKLYEDRNLLLTDGGQITYTGTSVMFSESLKLAVNSQVAGGSPTIIDLGSTTRSISVSGRMIYAVINRLAGTAVITDDASSLPAQTSANQEVVLIAKRVDAGDGTKRLYFRNGTALNEGQTSRLGASGSGSGSGFTNYIGNPDAEGGTTGWATYADAAAATPVDGTGGSPNVTWTQTPISPLRGTNSFLFTKDATNRQGQGVAYDFEIDNADLAKVLNINFDYYVNSGTYADGDLTVYLYDVTNSLVIQPSGYIIENAATGLPLKQIATFQTAINSTSYRLIFHVASTSALAYTLKIDNVFAGPQMVQNGTPITDWVQYTPTIVGFGSPTAVSFWSRRVGSNLEVQGLFNSGTTTAVTASVTIGFSGGNANVTTASGSSLPAGNYSRVGGWSSAGSTQGELATLALPSETILYFGRASFPTTASGSPMLGNDVVSIGQVVSFEVSIPIAGWSSNVQMSSDTDTRVVAAKYASSMSQVMVNGDRIQYNTKIFDTHNAVTTGASWVYTVPVSGIYEILGRVGTNSFTPSLISDELFVDIFVNGVRINVTGGDSVEETTTSRAFYSGGSTLASLKAGDTVYFSYNFAEGSTLNGSVDHNYIWIHRLSGPSLIAATEKLAAIYTQSSGQTFTNATETVIDYSIKDHDTHSAVTTGGSWHFTAPQEGFYNYSAYVEFSFSPVTAGSTSDIRARKNGTAFHRILLAFEQNGAGQTYSNQLAGCVYLLAGETLDFTFRNDSGVSISLGVNSRDNRMSITRL
jgi:hypothetical protein